MCALHYPQVSASNTNAKKAYELGNFVLFLVYAFRPFLSSWLFSCCSPTKRNEMKQGGSHGRLKGWADHFDQSWLFTWSGADEQQNYMLQQTMVFSLKKSHIRSKCKLFNSEPFVYDPCGGTADLARFSDVVTPIAMVQVPSGPPQRRSTGQAA